VSAIDRPGIRPDGSRVFLVEVGAGIQTGPTYYIEGDCLNYIVVERGDDLPDVIFYANGDVALAHGDCLEIVAGPNVGQVL
jgi:hypothetical protein